MNRSVVLGWCSQPARLGHKCDRHFDFPPLCNRAAPEKRFFGRYSGPTATIPHLPRRHDDYTPPPESGGDFFPGLGHQAKEKEAEKDFYLSLLSSASTKREVKSYLSRFKTQKSTSNDTRKPDPPHRATPPHNLEPKTGLKTQSKLGVNLGNIFGDSATVENVPVFTQDPIHVRTDGMEATPEKLHVALVELRKPQLLNDHILHGVGQTLSQLSRLGMSCCVVIDAGGSLDEMSHRHISKQQADRLSAAIDANHGPDSRRIDSAIAVSPESNMKVSVLSRNLLLSPLRQGHVVVVAPVGYTTDTQRAVPVPAGKILLALTKELAGLEINSSPDEDAITTAGRAKYLQMEISLDRLIILDPSGGIPSLKERPHVFVNLEQEYDDIMEELNQKLNGTDYHTSSKPQDINEISPFHFGRSNPISKFVDEEVVPLPKESGGSGRTETVDDHLNNLTLLQQTLSYLPPSSSGIIVTPYEIATSPDETPDASTLSAVGTRRSRNPLIHNLLTDRPILSASLPLGRICARNGATPPSQTLATHSTFVKRGMPLTLLPDPRVRTWTPDNFGDHILTLDDSRIDLQRLVYLIEDSFDRKLDARRYIDRVNKRLAGLIIAGEYEGGAILTWETPPGVPDDGSEESRSRMVPYLDKFAVLKRSQGAGGVSDIVFNAMVRTCFPNGVCWRSRADNPVNKWYFERSRGTWKLPGTNWTMFWTTDGVPENQQKFWDYEGVCRSIVPTWADNKQQVD
ncbi:Amino-acid acetyltransferase, mitochondrial [Ophidiomyces ophidiicola]|nr:Amino-acid acetyltransferase, mitochondrial [Ophidiomyces ophidiicola]